MAEFIELAVADGTFMRAYAARPAAGVAVRGGLLLFQEAFGVNHHMRGLAERFAASGYLTLSPELYHRTGTGFEGDYEDFAAVMPHMKALRPQGLEADIHAAHSWLVQQAPGPISAVGYCMGGRVAAMAAAAVPLRAAASFYGGDLPSLRDRVERIAAPLMLVWGDQDTHIPVSQRQSFADLLRAAKKPFLELTFSEAGHGFFCDERKSYHAASARQAWSMLQTFFDDPA